MKGAKDIDVSSLVSKSDLASLKDEVGKIGIYKLKSIPAHLSKVINVVDNMLLKNYVWWIGCKS